MIDKINPPTVDLRVREILLDITRKCTHCEHHDSCLHQTWVAQEQQAKRQRSAAIADSRRLSAALERCQLCISSQRRPRHLTLAIGEASYLMLPQKYAFLSLCALQILKPQSFVSSSQRRPRHLTLAIGEASYLMLPQKYVRPCLSKVPCHTKAFDPD